MSYVSRRSIRRAGAWRLFAERSPQPVKQVEADTVAGSKSKGHQHAEAFVLMTYESDDGAERVTVWNSRDGVTPFVVTLPSGREARHINWGGDVYAPDHQPADGDLVFIDTYYGLDRWRDIFRRRVEMAPQYAPPEGPDRDAFIDGMAKAEMVEHGEEPVPSMVVWPGEKTA